MKRPIIGLSCNFKPHEGENGTFNIDRSYTEAIYLNGGIPQIIPILPSDEIPELLNLYDGILLSGGGGLLPHIKKMTSLPNLSQQNPIRYKFEAELIKCAIKKEMPILGLCRGHQMINEILGGTIVNLSDKRHRQEKPGNEASHKILIKNGTVLYSCINNEEVQVNSFHSQVIEKVGEGLRISAYSDDDIIEAIEHSSSSSFIMGLQFHPEFMLANEKMMNIYKSFITAASHFKNN